MTTIPPGELALNQLVTVFEWELSSHGGRDQSYVGDVLRVTAIMLPFVVVKQLTGGYGSDRPFELDTRRVTFAPVTQAYVEALGVKVEVETSSQPA